MLAQENVQLGVRIIQQKMPRLSRFRPFTTNWWWRMVRRYKPTTGWSQSGKPFQPRTRHCWRKQLESNGPLVIITCWKTETHGLLLIFWILPVGQNISGHRVHPMVLCSIDTSSERPLGSTKCYVGMARFSSRAKHWVDGGTSCNEMRKVQRRNA